jgi:superfamily II DNA or RNA helicase
MFDPTCLRRTANWSSLEKEHKFDKNTFDPAKLLEDLPVASPKLHEMLKKIKELDENDLKYHGKTFKHFIFSEVKSGGYGARVIVGALLAVGMSLCYDEKLKLRDDDELIRNAGNNFGYLCSTTINEQTLPVATKKGMLEKYNRRPDNVQGELIRIIVADGGFKEGIDLFDVRYVHIFEPQTSEADLKQAIGRATRKCGQAGLEFHPSFGWTLNVYIYDVLIPEKLKGKLDDAETLFDLYLKNTNMDFKKVNFAKQMEQNVIFGAVDYPLNRNIIDLRGGARKNPQPPKLGDEVFCDRPCSINRPSKYVPVSLPLFITVAIVVDAELPEKKLKKPRQHFCKLLRTNRKFCHTLQRAFTNQAKFIHRYSAVLIKAIEEKVHMKINSSLRINFLKFIYTFSSNSAKKKIMNAPDVRDVFHVHPRIERYNSNLKRVKKQYGSNNGSIYDTNSKEITINSKENEEHEEHENGFEYLLSRVPRMTDKLHFKATRDFIVDNYGMFTWPKVEMENLCVSKGGNMQEEEPSAENVMREMEEELQKVDQEKIDLLNNGVNRSILATFTPTQDFIRHYFTPDNPYKGMLLFHSVGTGKTCTAIATATSSFEREGWTVLWVTRTTLKDDIWKNMFDTVCSLNMQEKLLKGVKFPQKLTDKMRLLSKSWSIRPMSYKQFTNLVAGNNKSLADLVKKNGSDDPLRKTLLIIDEAHKLYGGSDLLPAEKPDMNKLNAALQNSYQVSGKDSVKLLLMTATPYTKDPMELIKLLNLLQEKDDKLPTLFDEFQQVFLDESSGVFTEEGRDIFLEKINGLISFLDRGNDAREFAQPKVSLVTVPLSLKPVADIIKLKQEHDINVVSLKNVIKQLDESFDIFKDTKLKQVKDELKHVCGHLKGQSYIDCKNKSTPYIQLLLKSIEEMSLKIKKIQETHSNEIKRLNIEFAKVKEIAEHNISQEHVIEKCVIKK